jgi:Na+/melibiose symporter-like transporter
MGLISVLVRSLRMLFRTGGMFLTFGMVTLAMMFSGGAMCLGCVIMMLGSLVMFVFCQCKPRRALITPRPRQPVKHLPLKCRCRRSTTRRDIYWRWARCELWRDNQRKVEAGK